MKTQAIVMTFTLAGTLAMSVHGASALAAAPGDIPLAAAAPVLRVAWLSEAERQMLREQWRVLPPEERDRLREKLRAERGEVLDDGFGQGFEVRRREDDAEPPRDGAGNWGRPRPGERLRDMRRRR